MKTKFILILIFFIIFLNVVSAQQLIYRTSNSETTCINNLCTTEFYVKDVFIYYNNTYIEPKDEYYSLIPSSEPLYSYELNQTYNPEFRVYFKENPSEGQVVKYILKGSEFTFQPMMLNYRNDLKQIQQISTINSTSKITTDINVLTYNEIYENNISLSYKLNNKLLKESLKINSFGDLVLPESYILSGGNPTLDLDFIFSTNSKIIIDGAEWDKSSTTTSENDILIYNSSGSLLYTLKRPIITDANDNFIFGKYQLKKSGNSLYIIIKTPYSWLQTATYPVEIDPTIKSIYGDYVMKDSYVSEKNSNTNYGTSDWLLVSNFSTGTYNKKYRSYMTFDLTSINSQSIITDAKLRLYYDNSPSTPQVGENYNISVYNLPNNWINSSGSNILNETQITWNNQPCGVDFNNDTNCNLSVIATNNTAGLDFVNSGSYYWDISDFMSPTDFLQSNLNVSFVVRDTNENNNTGGLAYLSSDYFIPSVGPTLIITYYGREPIVTLRTPIDGSTTSNSIENFVCNITSIQDELTNVTLYIYNSTGYNINSSYYNISGLINSTTTTGNLSSGDGLYYWNCLAYNNITNSSWATNNFTIYLETSSPAITLNYPLNNSYFNNGSNIYFNYTAVDANGLYECRLYENWTSSWNLNYSWLSPTNNTMNYINLTVPEGKFLWNIWCNDTLNNYGYYYNNYTVTIDETSPSVTITDITTVIDSTTLNFTYTISDTNIDNCYFSIYDSSGDVEAGYTNSSIDCSLVNNTIEVSSTGTYSIYLYGEDKANNKNYYNSTFTVSSTSADDGGGAGVVVVASNFTWEIVNSAGGSKFDYYMGSGDTREGELYLYNIENAKGEVINLECEDIDKNYCDFINFNKNSIILLNSTTMPVSVKFTILIPSDYEVETGEVKLVGIDSEGNRGEINLIIRKEFLLLKFIRSIINDKTIIFNLNIPNYVILFILTLVSSGVFSLLFLITINKKSRYRVFIIPISLVLGILVGSLFTFFII